MSTANSHFKICLALLLINFWQETVDLTVNDSEQCQSRNKSCANSLNHTILSTQDNKYILPIKSSSSKWSNRQNKCTPTVTLEQCNSRFEDDPKWIWSRRMQYPINAKASPGCASSTLNYTWSIDGENMETYYFHESASRVSLRYYALDPGNYTVTVKVTEMVKGKVLGEHFAKCMIRIKHEDPVPVIKGGTGRTVPSETAFNVDGSESLNMDAEPGTTGYLNYKWYCIEGPQPFCSGKIISKASTITIPSKKAIDGTTFIFRLTVSTVYSKWFATKQTVKVKKGARQVYISCLKNCGPKVNHRLIVYLQAHCSDCSSNNYKWSMMPGQNNKKTEINFESETAYGSNNVKLIINEQVLQPGDTYTFTAIYDGGKGESSTEIKVAALPEKGNCEIKPTEGGSLTTAFNVICQGFKHTDPLTYQIFQLDAEMGGQGVLLDTNIEGQFTLFLSAGKTNPVELLLKVCDIDGLCTEQKLAVSVSSGISELPPDQQIQKVIDEYAGKNTQRESVESLIVQGESERAIQMINSLTAEVRHISNNAEGLAQFKKKWKAIVVEDLDKFPWESLKALRQIAATIKNLNWLDKAEIDRDFAKAATRLCSQIASRQINYIAESPSKGTVSEDVAELSQDLMWCADTNMKSNLTDLEREDTIFNITTAYPPLTFPFVPENYPNYDDADLEYAQKKKDYQEITANAMHTIILTGMGIAETQAVGEPVKLINNYTNIVQVITDESQLFPQKILGSSGSLVAGSDSLKDWTTLPVHAVITTYNQNPFWWDPEAKNFSTGVLDVNYFIKNQRIGYLKSPIQLLFDANKTDPVLVAASVSVPTNFNEWTSEELNRNMTVHRVDIRKGAALRTEFFGLADEDKLQVAVTYNRRPNLDDFKTAKLLSPGDTVIMSMFPLEMQKFGDAWCYIAVLPDKSMIRESKTNIFTYNYNVTFVSPLCVYWDTFFEKWNSDGCLTGELTNLTKLHCYCWHQTAYSGVYLNPPNKIDKIMDAFFTLNLHWNYVIFICVCVVFAIYCVALIFATKRSPSKAIFFLGDNVQNERYAYLLTIKTGNFYSAGTTSNVGVKLFGNKCNTRTHVVNYPDPDKKLLQRGNEDWFVLTTQRHLGNIEHIYIWHDSIGFRPSWYCEWITIHDLQENNEWYFDVQKWFSVLKEELRYLSVKPSSRKISSSWKHIWRKNILTATWEKHSWNICTLNKESDLSYIQSITIILSIILTTYLLAMIMYGTPGLRLSDGFGYGHYDVYFITIIVAFFSSLLSFFLHLMFTMLFTNSLLRYQNESKGTKYLNSSAPPVWILISLTVVLSLTLLTVFGFWVAYVTSLLWLSSTIGALIQTVLLLENIHILVKALLWNKKPKNTAATLDTSAIIQEAEHQRHKFFALFGYSLLRPYFAQKYRPLTREEWKVKREQQITKQKIAELLQDLIMFAIYIVILYVVMLASKDSLNIYSHKEMESLVSGKHTRTMDFTSINTVNEFYEYINKTLIPSIHPSNWYGRWEMVEPALMADFNIKIVGLVRFRQLRVCDDCCTIPYEIRGLNVSCYPDLSYWYNDVGEYIEYWKPKTHTAVPRLIDVWKYQYDAMPSVGELTVYSGGGYGAPLGRTLYNSLYNLKYYQETRWIDERSRTLHVEFLAYNANYNIFHAVKLLVERSASGLFIKTLSICTTRFLFVKLELQTMIFITFAAFITIILIMLFKTLYLAIKHWTTYFKELWNVVDIVIILMSFTCVGLYVYRIYLIGDLQHQFETKKHNVFVSYFDLIYLEEALTLLASVLICVATVRLWKLLRFDVVFKIMERTLILSARPLTAVSICHLIIILMYTFSGYLLFGTQSRDFNHLTATLTSLILLSLNLHKDFNYKFLENSYGGLGYIYYTSYMLISVTIFTLYIAVIVLGYTESGNYYSNQKAYYSVQKFVRDEWRYFTELSRKRMKLQRLAGGTDNTDEDELPKKATSKGDEHRYADSVIVPTYKIFVMSLISKCVVFNYLKDKKRKSVLSTYQEDLMRTTVFHLLSKQDIPEPNSVAFASFDKERKIKLVSNNRLLKMEYVVNCILNEGTLKNSKTEMFEDDPNEIIIAGKENSEQLEYFEDALKTILEVLGNINIVIPDNQSTDIKESSL